MTLLQQHWSHKYSELVMFQDTVVSYFKVLPQQQAAKIKENHKNISQDNW
jgi:hypothetical protein